MDGELIHGEAKIEGGGAGWWLGPGIGLVECAPGWGLVEWAREAMCGLVGCAGDGGACEAEIGLCGGRTGAGPKCGAGE